MHFCHSSGYPNFKRQDSGGFHLYLFKLAFINQLYYRMTILGSNLSVTHITAMGCWQCSPLNVVRLKCKHCRKPRNGVVDTFGLGLSSLAKKCFRNHFTISSIYLYMVCVLTRSIWDLEKIRISQKSHQQNFYFMYAVTKQIAHKIALAKFQ